MIGIRGFMFLGMGISSSSSSPSSFFSSRLRKERENIVRIYFSIRISFHWRGEKVDESDGSYALTKKNGN